MPDVRCSATPSDPTKTRSMRTASLLGITAGERAQLAELASEITADPRRNPLTYCAQADRAALDIPRRLAWALRQFSDYGSDSGMFVVQGVDAGPVPATPPDNTSHVGGSTLLARSQALINHAIGKMVAYEGEAYGHLYQDMVPKREAARTQTSLSSGTELELHTEQAFSELKPDWVSLACARGNDEAQTFVFSAHRLLRYLSDEEIDALREPTWVTGVDESFCLGEHAFIHGDVRGPLAILRGSRNDPTIVLDQDLMRGTTAPADHLLRKVLDLYTQHRSAHVLAPGEVLLLDNRRAVHGRSPFVPRWNGKDRFIVRSFVVRDLMRSAEARSESLVVDARYS